MQLIHIPSDIQLRLENHLMAGHDTEKRNWLGRKMQAKWVFGIYLIYPPLPDETEACAETPLYYIERESLLGLYPAIGQVIWRFVFRRQEVMNK